MHQPFTALLARRRLLPWLLTLSLLQASNWAGADEKNPLEPIDTSSPRATLQGYLQFMNEAYSMAAGLVQSYLSSSRLFLSAEEIESIREGIHRQRAAQRVLDTSALPPALVDESSRRIALQLKEILDRIDLPPADAIPDAKAMRSSEFKRWTLPGSEIRIVRVESGPRSGEYLFGAETVERIPEFYQRIQYRPYKQHAQPGLYDFIAYSPTGPALALQNLVPPRWILSVPAWSMATVLDQPIWRWIAMALVLGLAFLIVLACHRLGHRWSGRAEESGPWSKLLTPLSLVIVSPLTARILAEVLRISGAVYEAATLALWGLFFISLTWLVWVSGGAVAETIIGTERIRASSIDSQLIRLMLRLLTIVAAIAILVIGADRIGLPAYSVLAGLGVGGLAVALAAQQTLANLLGSLIIMFEKPFAVGHYIKVQGIEGTVENVGFRSTRIRTFYNSLISIPSSQLVNSTVDNMELRETRQVKTLLNLTYDTPPAKIQAFCAAVRRLLETDPDTAKDVIQVNFHDFGPHSLDILLNFFLKVPDRSTELRQRERILLAIVKLAESQGVRFAYPTRTLQIESWPDQTAFSGPGKEI
jgi:MscS family membrane protein